jgi:hypothetical protein
VQSGLHVAHHIARLARPLRELFSRTGELNKQVNGLILLGIRQTSRRERHQRHDKPAASHQAPHAYAHVNDMMARLARKRRFHSARKLSP